MRQTSPLARLTTAGETILAPLSFLLYRATRFGVQRLVQLQGRSQPAEATTWQTLDGQALRKPLNLLALMTSAPRWNTHAIIALAGPLRVQHTLRIHSATAAKSAGSWTVVVHAEPTHRIVGSIGSLDAAAEGPWRTVDLAPGVYRLALRYYHWRELIELPAVEVDGTPALRSLVVPADVNDYYHDLADRGSFLYLCLHSYVCTLLRHRRWFPRSFVEREYLPAGNPQTTFHYGFLKAGTRLLIELDAGLLQTHDVYFTAYNRASFPVIWYPLAEPRHRTPPMPVTGTYLIRVHARSAGRTVQQRELVRVRATEPTA